MEIIPTAFQGLLPWLSLFLSVSYSLSFCRTFSCSINNDITDIARSLLMRLMAVWAMGNVRVGSGWLTSLSSHLFYMPYTNMIVFVSVWVCKFPPGIAETIKNKAYKNAAWTTRRTTNPGQMLSADCLPTIVRHTNRHTQTQTHLVAHMCTYTHTVACIRKPAGLMHAQVENATKKKATPEYSGLLYTP